MPATRTALPRPAAPAKHMICLDCPDCTGPCWSRFELGFLPETVLHPRTPRA